MQQRTHAETVVPSGASPPGPGRWNAKGNPVYNLAGAWPFILVHCLAFGALWTPVATIDVTVGVALYWIRMFGITAGYHRYFSHRSYKTSRWFQFVLAMLAMSSSQKGVLWWAAHHRHHHKYSDRHNDIHSPKRHGLLYAHMGWVFNHTENTDYTKVRDLARYPELVLLNKYWGVPPVLLAVGIYWCLGLSGLFIGFMASTAVLWHGTFTINSLTHMWGRPVYETGEDSKNSFLLALITMGEGWHNNHHYYQASAAQGFHWWQIDLTYYILRLLGAAGLVWDLREVPEHVVASHRLADRATDAGSARR
ncbi:MAG: acyl-CoA desaturase [Nannocystaceae bacterium]